MGIDLDHAAGRVERVPAATLTNRGRPEAAQGWPSSEGPAASVEGREAHDSSVARINRQRLIPVSSGGQIDAPIVGARATIRRPVALLDLQRRLVGHDQLARGLDAVGHETQSPLRQDRVVENRTEAVTNAVSHIAACPWDSMRNRRPGNPSRGVPAAGSSSDSGAGP